MRWRRRNCARSAWKAAWTVSSWTVVTCARAPSVASSSVSAPFVGSMWCAWCTSSEPDLRQGPHFAKATSTSSLVPVIWTWQRASEHARTPRCLSGPTL
uniref:Putative secreted protein n=1 Tax=Ixodes ricinus TaxID=34613 RepID=A0A6B0U5I3_IXORI